MKRFLSVIIALIILVGFCVPIFSAYNVTSYRISAENLALFSDSGGAGLLSYQGGNCHFERLSPNAGSADISLNHTITSAAIFGNTIVALCNDSKDDQLEVYLYRSDTDVLDSFVINDLRIYADVGFYYASDSIYLVSDRRANIIERYSTSGVLIGQYTFNNAVTQLGSDYRGGVFAVSGQTLYRLNSGRFNALGSSEMTVPITFIDSDHLTDASGRVFRLSGDTCEQIFRTDSSFGKHYACAVDGCLYYPSGCNIYGYQLSSGEKRSVFSLSDPILGLYAYRGYIFAVCNNESVSVTKLRADEFTDLSHKWDSASSPSSSGAQDIDMPDAPDYTISSSAYRIDFDAYRISGIPSGTTFAELKRNIVHNGYTMRLYRGGSEKKSGSCGTAMEVVFESDRATYTFELSVIGDLTGEGNVNSRDLTVLMEYLIGVTDFNGVYTLSADLSGNDIVDVKDLALLHRMI